MDWTDVKFPTPLTGNSLSNFEKRNNVGVLVIGYRENRYLPLRQPGGNFEKVVKLFYFSNGEKNHYACISNLPRLLSSSASKHHGKIHFGFHCLSSISPSKMEEHVRLCSEHPVAKVIMPEEGSVCRFKSYQNTNSGACRHLR